jgi:GTP cyclohydrolase II
MVLIERAPGLKGAHPAPPAPDRPIADADEAAMLAVEVAIATVRRGMSVAVISAEAQDRQLLALPVEDPCPQTLLGWYDKGGEGPSLALTAERVRHLRPEPASSSGGGVAFFELASPLSSAGLARVLADPLLAAAGTALPPAGCLPEAQTQGRAAVELMKLAGLLPAALVLPLPQGTDGAAALGHAGTACRVQARDVLDYQVQGARQLRIIADARVPLVDAEPVRLVAFRPATGGGEHLAIIVGAPERQGPTLVRIHSSCLTGDVLGSLRCDCGQQLRGAIRYMREAGGGIVLYLSQEGRGIGLVNKLRAYTLQDHGHDTVDANEMLGFDADERCYAAPAVMLRQLACTRVRLLTNNPDKVRALEAQGIAVVERVPHVFPANNHNLAYLRTKARRSGHLL